VTHVFATSSHLLNIVIQYYLFLNRANTKRGDYPNDSSKQQNNSGWLRLSVGYSSGLLAICNCILFKFWEFISEEIEKKITVTNQLPA
jgi:hypothetical protein